MVVIVILALVFLKPEQLPELGKRAGIVYGELMRAVSGVKDSVASGAEAKPIDDNNGKEDAAQSERK